MTINEKIKKLRKEKGMTQEELANQLGITTGHITRLENGNFYPSVEVVIKISKMFEVSTDFLLDNTIDNEYEQTIENLPLTKKVKMIMSLDNSQQEALLVIIDSMIKEKKMREVLLTDTNKKL